MRIRSLVSGIFSYIPGGNTLIFERRKARRPFTGTANARYCYSVWLRHMVLANKHGLLRGVPLTVAELGPGKSIGTGLAALLSGAERYYALDVVNHTKSDENLTIFEQIVELFRNRSRIPDNHEFPLLFGELDCYDFPSHLLSDEILSRSLSESRLDRIRNEMRRADTDTRGQRYINTAVPWFDKSIVRAGSIDMLFSNKVMEHVDDLQSAYRASRSWLHNDGIMSMEIDFSCHGHAEQWNGHWTYSHFVWKLIRGNRPYFINREPLSSHIKLIEDCKFHIVASITRTCRDSVGRHQLSSSFRNLSDRDLNTCGAFVIAVKKPD